MKDTILFVSHSGGLDSSTLMTKALHSGYTVVPIKYNYGQKNRAELTAQSAVHEELLRRYPDTLKETISIDLTTCLSGPIEKFQENRDSGKSESNTDMKYYMPSRNLLFMSMTAVIAEILTEYKYKKILIGLGVHKHSAIYERDYWDISVEFVDRLSALLALNDCVNIGIYSPYKDKFKQDIITDAYELGVPIHKTWTCYSPNYIKQSSNEDGTSYVIKPCLECEACLERQSQANETGFGDDINDYSLSFFIENTESEESDV
jgi:7-cyano-7-deazaguanine synthase